MNIKTVSAIGLSGLLLLGGCATFPTGPSVLALPGSGKTFDRFRQDDAECQQYAFQQIGGTTAQQAADSSAARSAALGTVVGAVAGAALSLAVARLAQASLFGIGAFDPPAFLLSLVLLAAAALLACLLPALRAARVAPAEALRSE